MVIYLKGISKPYVMVLDIEHDHDKLIQLSCVLLKNVGVSLFQLYKSYNVYIKQKKLTPFIKEYLRIDEEFLMNNGSSLEKVKEEFFSKIVNDIDPDDILVVSHGIHQDDLTLFKNGINIGKYEQWCTYEMAKGVLQRLNNLTLSDVAAEAGYAIIDPHCAYADVWATVAVFSFLLKVEEEYDEILGN